MHQPSRPGLTRKACAHAAPQCGGAPSALLRAEPLLLAMGKRSIECGPAGAGQIAKVANNLTLAIQMAAVSEGLALGQALGIDPRTLSQVFNTSSARCWSSEVYNPCPGVMEDVPAARDYTPGFTTQLCLKDVGLALQAAEEVGAATPMGKVVVELYKQVGRGARGSTWGSTGGTRSGLCTASGICSALHVCACCSGACEQRKGRGSSMGAS